MSDDVDWQADKDCLSSLNLGRIRFPSDSLTIKDLRRILPDSFDKGFGFLQPKQPVFFLGDTRYDKSSARELLGGTLNLERVIAVDAFLQAHDGKKRDCTIGQAAKTKLADAYIFLGLAEGERLAAELINSIIKQSQTLGKSAKGGRGR